MPEQNIIQRIPKADDYIVRETDKLSNPDTQEKEPEPRPFVIWHVEQLVRNKPDKSSFVEQFGELTEENIDKHTSWYDEQLEKINLIKERLEIIKK